MPSHKHCIRSETFTAGFTLIELVVSIGILIIIFGLGAFVSMDTYRTQAFASEKTTLHTLLQKARSQAQHHVDGKAHGVYVTQSAYILFTGSSYAMRDTAKDISFPATPSIRESGLSEIVFAPLTARVASPGSMTLTDGVRSATFFVNDEGGID